MSSVSARFTPSRNVKRKVRAVALPLARSYEMLLQLSGACVSCTVSRIVVHFLLRFPSLNVGLLCGLR
ncbi:hypothetical protein SAMN05192543_1011161 [Paraburkholderia megapolitana]|uniref:Uncharacterized protein n=1 Tax=Paraburkholderia megapolitana TaxID=420953 RepID=A0A1I3EXN1_9BURK|nr:hypothetical protein SAMN05192543_1011161 [Paraburkholderia megapolitana]